MFWKKNRKWIVMLFSALSVCVLFACGIGIDDILLFLLAELLGLLLLEKRKGGEA